MKKKKIVLIFLPNCHRFRNYPVKNMYPSSKGYDRRASDSFWRQFVIVCQVFCVAHYSIFRPNTWHVVRMLYFVAITTLHVVTMIYNFDSIHIVDNINYKRSVVINYVSLLGVTGNFIAHLVANFEPFFSQSDEEKLYKKLREINEIFATKLNYVVDFNALRRTFFLHTVIFFIFSASFSFSFCLFTLPSDNKLIFLTFRMIYVLIIRIRRCQMAMHVNHLTNILMDLQVLLKHQQESYHLEQRSFESREKIRYLRYVYTNAWMITKSISDCFGWSFVCFLIEYSVDLINFCFWAYINVRSNGCILKTIRMSLFFLHLFC